MKYKVKRTYKGVTYSRYKIFYKKWYWLFWVDTGYEGSSKDHLLRIVHDLYREQRNA